jgi:hypothetical protein
MQATVHAASTHDVDNPREFRQHPVVGVFDDPAFVLADLWLDELPKIRPESFVGSFLVEAHQP